MSELPVGSFGKPDGVDRRLAAWARQLSCDKSYPWVGSGLIDDLKCAAKILGTDFDVMYPSPIPEDDEFAAFRAARKAAAPPPPEEDEFAAFHAQQQADYDL